MRPVEEEERLCCGVSYRLGLVPSEGMLRLVGVNDEWWTESLDVSLSSSIGVVFGRLLMLLFGLLLRMI